jgi:hypothetical protein
MTCITSGAKKNSVLRANEAAKTNLEINPGSGEGLERNVKELLRLDPALVARLKAILK